MEWQSSYFIRPLVCTSSFLLCPHLRGSRGWLSTRLPPSPLEALFTHFASSMPTCPTVLPQVPRKQGSNPSVSTPPSVMPPSRWNPAYITYMQSTSCEMPGWMKHKLESRLLGEISVTSLRYAGDSTLMAESKEELKSLLMKVKQESEKAGLKLNTEKRRPWHLVPSLHGKLMGKQWKQWQALFSWAPESLQMVTAAMIKDACSLEEKLWQT